MKHWFDVDAKGLAKLLERKGREFVLFELIQNAWDENTTTVIVTLERIAGTRFARLTVQDDNPEGFSDLTHAFTLFAESAKKGDATKRGRFNLGEKLVLALCVEAKIESTTGGVVFDSQKGRHVLRAKTERGSIFTGKLRMTDEEIKRCGEAMRTLLCPPNIVTVYNGERLPSREASNSIEVALPTEVADEEGILRPTQRKTQITFYEPLPGEKALLFELGIPVVETGDRWHVDVGQKVPLNFDRDNVTPAYLSRIRALTVETMCDSLTSDDANASWVREAFQRHGSSMSNETVTHLTELRFGKKRVSFDPSDPEANSIAASQGYTVVHGRQMQSDEWDIVRRAGALLPAGQVTPSPKPYSDNGDPLKRVPQEKWTPRMHKVVEYLQSMAYELLGCSIGIEVVSDVTWPSAATYGPGILTLNLGRLGHRWFEGSLEQVNDLMIHEFGHHFSMDHLSSEYHAALTRLGAKLTGVALAKPALFQIV